MRVKELPRMDRPREKLRRLGPSALTNTELLALILGSGTRGANVLEVAERLLKKYGGERLVEVSLTELSTNRGVGKAKASTLIACFELARRLFKREEDEVIKGPEEVYELTKEIRTAKKEHVVALYLDARNRILKKETISIGSLTANIVHPREVFQPAVGLSAASVILVHNHPSGDPTPSQDDLALTRRLLEAGRIMGIEVLDHVIVGAKRFLSLKEEGLL